MIISKKYQIFKNKNKNSVGPAMNLRYPSLLSHFLPIYHRFWHQSNPSRNPTTYSHASRCHNCDYCHYCNVDFVIIHDVIGYIDPRLSCIRNSTIYLLNITCTLVVTRVILGRLECTVDTVCWNLRHTYLMEVDLMQILAKHETLFIVFHVGIHVIFSFIIISLGP